MGGDGGLERTEVVEHLTSAPGSAAIAAFTGRETT
jgi:hypothetical protein